MGCSASIPPPRRCRTSSFVPDMRRGCARISLVHRILPGWQNELRPVRPKGLDRMLSALFAVAAAQIVGRAVTIAAPAYALGMRGPFRYASDHHSPAIL